MKCDKPRSQVHYATYSAQALADRLSGRKPAEPVEVELDTYEKARARVQQVLDTLDRCNKEDVNSIGETMTKYPRHGEEIEVPVKVLATQVILPNVYFHTAMAYAILRKEGVPLGKRDWSRGFLREYI